MNKSTKIFIIHILALILLICFKADFTKINVLKDEFIVNFILALFGLFMAIITLLYGLIDKIITTFNRLKLKSVDNIYLSLKELKDNTFFIFIMLLCYILLSILADFDIPIVKSTVLLDKKLIIFDFKLIFLSLSMVATHDTIKTLFTMLNLSQKIN